MHNPRFAFYSPKTVEDACGILSRMKGRAVVMAGGTDLVPRMKQRLVEPGVVISLDQLQQLRYIQEDGNFLKIGALTTLQEIERSEAIKKHFPVLCKAAKLIAGPVHRAMGTIGGNLCLENRCFYYNQSRTWRRSVEPCFKTGGSLCHVAKAGKRCYAVYSADLAPVLMLLDVELIVVSAGKEKIVPISKFFIDNGLKANCLGDDELLVGLRIPLPTGKYAADYIKMRPRESVDFPVVGTAVMVKAIGDTEIEVRTAFTGVASCPFVLEVGRYSKPFEKQQIIEQVGSLAYKNVRPISRTGGSPAYKKRLAQVLAVDGVEKCLQEIVG